MDMILWTCTLPPTLEKQLQKPHPLLNSKPHPHPFYHQVKCSNMAGCFWVLLFHFSLGLLSSMCGGNSEPSTTGTPIPEFGLEHTGRPVYAGQLDTPMLVRGPMGAAF